MNDFKPQIEDHKDFLKRYGDVRTKVPTPAYKEGWDRIFKKVEEYVDRPIQVRK